MSAKELPAQDSWSYFWFTLWSKLSEHDPDVLGYKTELFYTTYNFWGFGIGLSCHLVMALRRQRCCDQMTCQACSKSPKSKWRHDL